MTKTINMRCINPCDNIVNLWLLFRLLFNFHSTISCFAYHFFIAKSKGCGFIGRHLVTYFVENDLVANIRVADKMPPQMAWLNRHHMSIFSSKSVEFCSTNLINSGRFFI